MYCIIQCTRTQAIRLLYQANRLQLPAHLADDNVDNLLATPTPTSITAAAIASLENNVQASTEYADEASRILLQDEYLRERTSSILFGYKPPPEIPQLLMPESDHLAAILLSSLDQNTLDRIQKRA